MKVEIKINRKQRLYVIPCKHGTRKGFTCLGFEYAFEKAKAVAAWLSDQGVWAEFPKVENVGTFRGYREYLASVMAAKRHFEATKQRCPVELCEQLIGLEGKRVEIVDIHGERRRFYVGKSTGWIPCHLEIARIDSTGGFPVMGTPFRSVTVIQTAKRR